MSQVPPTAYALAHMSCVVGSCFYSNFCKITSVMIMMHIHSHQCGLCVGSSVCVHKNSSVVLINETEYTRSLIYENRV